MTSTMIFSPSARRERTAWTLSGPIYRDAAPDSVALAVGSHRTTRWIDHSELLR